MTLNLIRRLVKGEPLTAEDHDYNLDILEDGISGAVQQNELGNSALKNVGTTAGTVAAGDDARFTNAREWTAETITQAEAEAGTATTRRAFTAQRVVQAAAAWWAGSSAKTKLDGIESGAKVNVNADWNAGSGDAQILNKPTLGTAAALNVGTSANNVVQLDGSAKLPSVDGSQLTGINAATDLSYTAATRVLASSTGTDATLPLFTSSDAGLVPSSGGGTTTFLRADGTFATAGSPPGGSNTQIQFNDGGAFGGDADLTYNKTTNKLTTAGDVELNDGGSFTTTLQTITPTANRTISFPDATGTVGLVAGSSGQITYNSSGAYAGSDTTYSASTGTRFTLPFGYGSGAGGTQTQNTNKATTVVLNARCGTITMNGAALAADTTVTFTLTNSQIEATDMVLLSHSSVGTFGAYTLNARAAAGSASIDVRNVSTGSLSEAIVLRFIVIKATTA